MCPCGLLSVVQKASVQLVNHCPCLLQPDADDAAGGRAAVVQRRALGLSSA